MEDGKFLFAQLIVQSVITIALLAFAWGMYTVVGGAGADSIGSMVVGGVITHWFKESASIGRRAATLDPKPR